MAIPELTDAKDRLTDCIYFGDPISASVGSGYVPTTRTIATAAPLTGGGTLAANRTLAISEFAGSVPGSVPTSAGGATTFLRADGAWSVPPTFGAAAPGYAPLSGGGTANFLRADGTWAAPVGTGISGLVAGAIPVASGAASLGNSRITEVVTGYSAVLGAGTATDAGLVMYGSPTLGTVLQAFDTVGGSYTSPLRLLAGGASTAYVNLFGPDVEIGKNLTVNAWAGLTSYALTLANGANVNIAVSTLGSYIRVDGPNAPFSIGGFAKTVDGAELVLYNSTDQPMTIKDQDAATTAAYRIITHMDSDITLPANTGVARFIYNAVDARWVLVSTTASTEAPAISTGYVPYQSPGSGLLNSSIYCSPLDFKLGIFNTTPLATVDITGSVATRYASLIVSNGVTDLFAAPTSTFLRINGPTAAFSIGGFTKATGEDGKHIILYNPTAQPMTILHDNAGTTAGSRIKTPTAADMVFPGGATIHLTYSAGDTCWIVAGYSSAPLASGLDGYVQFNSGGALSSGSGLIVSGSGANISLGLGSLFLHRKATNVLELGVPSALASSSPKSIHGTSTIGGTTNNGVGGKLSSGGGAGTGTGGGGDTALVTAPPGTFGNTQNTYVDRLYYMARPVPLTDSAATVVASVALATETGCGGSLSYTIYATDGTDMQILRGTVQWGVVNKAGVAYPRFGTPDEADCTPVGTLTVTVGAVDNAGNVDFTLNAVSSLTATTLQAWVSLQYDGVAGDPITPAV